jgi:hypothetical protein
LPRNGCIAALAYRQELKGGFYPNEENQRLASCAFPSGWNRPIDIPRNQKLTKVIAGRTIMGATVEPGSVSVLFDDNAVDYLG